MPLSHLWALWGQLLTVVVPSGVAGALWMASGWSSLFHACHSLLCDAALRFTGVLGVLESLDAQLKVTPSSCRCGH